MFIASMYVAVMGMAMTSALVTRRVAFCVNRMCCM